MTQLSSIDPMTVMVKLATDTGQRWGDIATDLQREDAAAVFGFAMPADSPRMHFITRPRGGSKTTDMAMVVLTAMLTQAPPASRSLLYARDADQADLVLDAIRGVVMRTPGIGDLVEIKARSLTVKRTHAKLTVEPADSASAFGWQPYIVVADEAAQWPSTRNSERLWEAIVSGMPKRADSRLIVMTSAGDPAHFMGKVLDGARTSSKWRVSEMPGPVPWHDPEDLEEQRRLLPESAFRRLHLNQWVSGEDSLVSADDLRACIAHATALEPRHGVRYQLGLDIGLKNDRTVLTVAHLEGSTVVVDRQVVMQGTKANPVSLATVEQLVRDTSTRYGGAPLRLDPWQAIGTAQKLRGEGMRVEEYAFTATSVGRLASNLRLLLHEHRVALPADDEGLLDELATVRLRTNSQGVVRMDHDSGRHDDRAQSLAMAALALTEAPTAGGSGFSIPAGRRPAASLRGGLSGTLQGTTPSGRHTVGMTNGVPQPWLLRRQKARSPKGLNSIVGVPGAHDDESRR